MSDSTWLSQQKPSKATYISNVKLLIYQETQTVTTTLIYPQQPQQYRSYFIYYRLASPNEEI